jgi:GTP-binding protein Era
MTFKAGYLALIGRPNVGKSTLLNKLLDFKLAITSPRPQTTRHRLMGIMNDRTFQIILLDTPGILEQTKYMLHQAMRRQTERAIADADVLGYMVDTAPGRMLSAQTVEEEIAVIRRMNTADKPVVLIINKVDLVDKPGLLPLIDLYRKRYPFRAFLPVSALQGDGLSGLLRELVALLPEHPPFYDPDTLTDRPEKFFVAELIREQIFLHFGAEIPYSTGVLIEEFTERENRKTYIRAVIFTERDSQKGILIGRKGTALVQIGARARTKIEQFLQRAVFLELLVKVRKNWRRDDLQLKRLGYTE